MNAVLYKLCIVIITIIIIIIIIKIHEKSFTQITHYTLFNTVY